MNNKHQDNEHVSIVEMIGGIIYAVIMLCTLAVSYTLYKDDYIGGAMFTLIIAAVFSAAAFWIWEGLKQDD